MLDFVLGSRRSGTRSFASVSVSAALAGADIRRSEGGQEGREVCDEAGGQSISNEISNTWEHSAFSRCRPWTSTIWVRG